MTVTTEPEADAVLLLKKGPPEGPPDLMKKHIIKRKKNEDGTWGEWSNETLCKKPWDRPFLPGLPACEECIEVLQKELGQ